MHFRTLNLTPDITISRLLVLGILNIEFQVGMSFSFTGTAGLGMGIDTSGVFINTDQTNITFAAGIRADAGVTVGRPGIDNPATATIGPEFTTTATLGRNLTGGTSDKAYRSDLVSGLDDLTASPEPLPRWRKTCTCTWPAERSSIVLKYQIRSPIGGIIDALGPVGHALEPFAEGFAIRRLLPAVQTARYHDLVGPHLRRPGQRHH